MQFKTQQAWSAFRWVTAPRYKIVGRVVAPRFCGLLHLELNGRLCSKTMMGVFECLLRTSVDDSGCHLVKRRQISKWTCVKLRDEASLRGGVYCLASELAFLVMWYIYVWKSMFRLMVDFNTTQYVDNREYLSNMLSLHHYRYLNLDRHQCNLRTDQENKLKVCELLGPQIIDNCL